MISDRTILEIVIAIVVDCFDKFGRFSVLQTLSRFFIHLREKFERLKGYNMKNGFLKLLHKKKTKT